MNILGRSIGLWVGHDISRPPPHSGHVLQLGFGEGGGKEYDRLYRRNLEIKLHPWRSCFVWYRQFLTVENGKPVYQDRIIGFWHWPISVNW